MTDHMTQPAADAGFAWTCLGHDSAAWRQREAAVADAIDRIRRSGVDMVRLGWCDLHGVVRAKALTVPAAVSALRNGLGMVGTLALKDGSDRTAFKVFEPGGAAAVPGFEGGGNMVLLPDPNSFRVLPWVAGTGWLRCDAWFQNGTPVELDTRRILQRAL